MYKDKEVKKKKSLEWYYKNKERSIARSTQWRKKNRAKYLDSRRLKYQQRSEEQKKKESERAKVNYHNKGGREKFLQKYHTDESFRESQRLKNLGRLKRRKELIYFLRIKMGGECTKCGYDEEPSILQFHHHDKNKSDNVTNLQTLDKIEEEASKCILLCPNCHALTHLKND